jgi:hypothetical protein
MDAWVLGEIMIKLLQKGKGFKLEKIITPIGLKLEKKDEKKEPKEEKKHEGPREKVEKKPDPSKIKDYERQIEFHTRKVEEFKTLLAKAQEM